MAALVAASKSDTPTARSTLEKMIDNVHQASEISTPVCQDTGTLIFYVDYGPDWKETDIARSIKEAAAEATKRYYLRQNAVDSITGKNSGDNTGIGAPYMHFHQRDEAGIRIRLLLKGGGSENVGTQYTLPNAALKAGRDLEGIRKCVIDAVVKAQGKGCAPGIIGVGVGGDRMSSYMESKEQFFRRLSDENPNPKLAELEQRLYKELNSLGIGPMGFGGNTTVLGVKIGARHRVPASYFVAVSYLCWAARRCELRIENGKSEYIQ
jgi:fumarate hydratase class I